MKAEVDPNTIVYFRGEYIPLRDARIGILTHALHYGTGVFEGIRGYWNEDEQQLFLVRAREHYQRWKHNCGLLRIDLPESPGYLCEITAELARRNSFRTDIYVRPLAYKSAERVGVRTDDDNDFALIAMPFGAYLPDKGLHAGISSWRRIDDNAIPARGKICGAYVNSVLASDDARQAGFDEALLLNESGHVAEGATCNVFMIRRGQLITPSVTENVLEGITRESVMEIAGQELRMPIVERPIDRSELYLCDELFLTGTAVGIGPVVRVDHRPIRDAEIGPLTREIRRLYFEAVRGRMPAYRRWLLPVLTNEHEAETHVSGAASA